ncbi:IncPalpha-type entry exclusion lipoprotein TrbK [Salmonella enterica]|nr:IncPalpha-type entry exclusion lipoprotein TrbK [Salmonella enterica]
MKKSNFIAVAALAAIMAASLAGCDNKPDTDKLTCADLPKVTDAAQRAELLKKCPRGEPGGFKPSEKKEW